MAKYSQSAPLKVALHLGVLPKLMPMDTKSRVATEIVNLHVLELLLPQLLLHPVYHRLVQHVCSPSSTPVLYIHHAPELVASLLHGAQLKLMQVDIISRVTMETALIHALLNLLPSDN